MQHRIRAAALICDGERILLVGHELHGRKWWVPPGGGLEPTDATLFDCCQRETYEETGLSVALSRIAYVREFRERNAGVLHLELFLLADSWNGFACHSQERNTADDREVIFDVRWFTRADLQDRHVFPECLKDQFWTDFQSGFGATRYLGMQEVASAAADLGPSVDD